MKSKSIKLAILTVVLSGMTGIATADDGSLSINVVGSVIDQTCTVSIDNPTITLAPVQEANFKTAGAEGAPSMVDVTLSDCGETETAGDVLLKVNANAAVVGGNEYFGGTDTGSAGSNTHLGIKVVNQTLNPGSASSSAVVSKGKGEQVKPFDYALIKGSNTGIETTDSFTGTLAFSLVALDNGATAGMAISAPITLQYAYL